MSQEEKLKWTENKDIKTRTGKAACTNAARRSTGVEHLWNRCSEEDRTFFTEVLAETLPCGSTSDRVLTHCRVAEGTVELNMKIVQGGGQTGTEKCGDGMEDLFEGLVAEPEQTNGTRCNTCK